MTFTQKAQKAGLLVDIRKGIEGFFIGDKDKEIIEDILGLIDEHGVTHRVPLKRIGALQRDGVLKPGLYRVMIAFNKQLIAGEAASDDKGASKPEAAPKKSSAGKTAAKPRTPAKKPAAAKARPKASSKKPAAKTQPKGPRAKPSAAKQPAAKTKPRAATKKPATKTKPSAAASARPKGPRAKAQPPAKKAVGPTLSIHKVAATFPPMSIEDFENLTADIAISGQLEPIVVHGKQIIDGVHRYRACQKLGIAPLTEKYDGDTSTEALTAFAVSHNLARRHLTSGQKAAIAAELLPEFEAEAKERQKGRRWQKDDKEAGETGKAAEHAARAVGTNPRYVADFKKLQVDAPDLAEQVKDGEITLSAAMSELKKRQAAASKPRQRKRTTTGTYGVVVVHAPGRTYKELYDSELAHAIGDDSVMFLWCKPTNIGEALAAMDTLGFSHKTTYTWLLEAAARAGTFLKDQTEHCLIGIKGKPSYKLNGQSTALFEYTEPEVAGEKPDEFYEVVEAVTAARKRLIVGGSKRKGYDRITV